MFSITNANIRKITLNYFCLKFSVFSIGNNRKDPLNPQLNSNISSNDPQNAFMPYFHLKDYFANSNLTSFPRYDTQNSELFELVISQVGTLYNETAVSPTNTTKISDDEGNGNRVFLIDTDSQPLLHRRNVASSCRENRGILPIKV